MSRTSEIINSLIIAAVLFLVSRFILTPIARLILDAWDFHRLQERKAVFLEITPPASSTKTPHATTQLFAAMHGLGNTRSRKDWFLQRKNIQSFEVVSSRSNGIRYIIQLSPNDVSLFKQLVVSYLPDVQFVRLPI